MNSKFYLSQGYLFPEKSSFIVYSVHSMSPFELFFAFGFISTFAVALIATCWYYLSPLILEYQSLPYLLASVEDLSI